MNWKIGEVAMCIKVGSINNVNLKQNPPPLRLDSEYIIQNIYSCPKCKAILLDVGLSTPINNSGEHKNTQCCTEFVPCAEIHWCNSRRFAKKKTKEEELEEAIAQEDYEKASQLRDELK